MYELLLRLNISIFYSILQWDTSIFYFINHTLQNPFFDLIMPIITEIKIWLIPLICIGIVLILRGGTKGRIVAILAIIILFLTDQSTAHILKPLFARPRPGNTLLNIHLIGPVLSSFSFPSCHAANVSGIAILFSAFYKRWRPLFLVITLLVSFSRIYIGVHYPSDIIGGWICGIFWATLIIGIAFFIRRIRQGVTDTD